MHHKLRQNSIEPFKDLKIGKFHGPNPLSSTMAVPKAYILHRAHTKKGDDRPPDNPTMEH